MAEKYAGTMHIEAFGLDRNGEEGYEVKYPDGHSVWMQKDDFAACFIFIGDMEDYPLYQQKVIGEKVLLDAKIKKLRAFFSGEIFFRMLPEEQDLLRDQVRSMYDYSLALGERIAKFE